MPRAPGLAEQFDDDLVPAVPEAPTPSPIEVVEVAAAPPPDEIDRLRAIVATMAARIKELEAPPPENFLPLKNAAVDCRMNYETLRSWAVDGHVTARREGVRLFVDTVSVMETKRRRGTLK
jgi:hypothetical protein